MSDKSDIRTVNVRDFGAVGDGVTDDLPVFVAAFRSRAGIRE